MDREGRGRYNMVPIMPVPVAAWRRMVWAK
jgi:hypothetical protein